MARLPPNELRTLIRDALPVESLEYGAPPPPHQFFVPKSHARALNPQIPVVIGDRGMGKSYWWAALQSHDHRTLLARVAADTRIGADTVVRPGFGKKLQPDRYPSKDVIAALLQTAPHTRLIWKTIALWNIVDAVTTASTGTGEPKGAVTWGSFLRSSHDVSTSWRERLSWLVANPESVDRLLVQADNRLAEDNRDVLLVFDALDDATDDSNTFFALIEGLCQLALELRSFRRVRAKVFLRTDQFEDPRVGRFPDASKLRASSAPLRWLGNELYGLLWSLLGNHPARGAEYRDDFYETLRDVLKGRDRARDASGAWVPPPPALFDVKVQELLFHRITGPHMGETARRGFPYRWLPTHLADARGVFSPRSFQVALKTAAEHSQENHIEHGFALHYRSLYEGLHEASSIRVEEMREHPWVQPLMVALAGHVAVPFEFADAEARWHEADALADADVAAAEIDSGDSARKRLAELGVWRAMKTGRIDVPDIYRLGFKLTRRGGVPLKRDREVS